MKKWLLLFILLVAPVVMAQQVTITGTVSDANGCVWAGGSGLAQLTPTNVGWTINNGHPVNQTVFPIVKLSSTGTFSIQLIGTNNFDQQSDNPTWAFSFTLPTATGNLGFSVPGIALTSSQDITAQITAAGVPLVPPSQCSTSGVITAKNVNNILFVTPTGYSTIKAAVAALPTVNSKPAGTVMVTTPLTMTAGNEVTLGPNTAIIFGPDAALTYTGTGVPFTCDDSPTSYAGNGGIWGLNVSSSTAAGAVDINECTWFHLDGKISMTATGAYGVRLENTADWTEQSDFDNLSIYAANPIDLQDNCAGHTGCPSMAYARWRHVSVSPAAGGIGVQFENDTSINHGDLDVNCFPAQGATCWGMEGTSEIVATRIWLRGELAGGATSATGISTAAGTLFTPVGLMESWDPGITDSLSGTVQQYAADLPGYGIWQMVPNGPCFAANANSYAGCLDVHNITAFRTWTLPDAGGTVALEGGTCTMAAGTSCTSTVSYGTHCIAQDTATIVSGRCSISGSTLTVTAASSNSDVWAWSIVN